MNKSGTTHNRAEHTPAVLKRRFANGDALCNVGNWTKEGRAWVRREFRKGTLARFWCIHLSRWRYLLNTPEVFEKHGVV